MRRWTALLIVLWALAASVAHAGDLDQEPYGLRLLLTLSRATNFASTAGQQASAADPSGASANPASDDVLRGLRAHDHSATFTAASVFSESGALFNVAALTAHFGLPEAGTLSVAYARTDTLDGETVDGLTNLLRSNEFFLGYSRRLASDLAVGGQVRFTEAEIEEEGVIAEEGPIAGTPLRLDSDLISVDISLGLYHALDEHWSWGVTANMSGGSIEGEVENLVPLFGGMVPPGSRLETTRDAVRSRLVRGGIGYRPRPGLEFYADLEYAHVDTNQLGSADTGRLLAGAEITPWRDLRLRGGVVVDTEGEVTLSTGAGYYGITNLPIELSYQYNAFPEVEREFGDFHLLTLSVTGLF